jgi:thiamine biosynthesis lipoprotein
MTGPSTGATDWATSDWELWSTTARLVVTDPDALGHARAICDRVLGDVDRAANRFDPTSELRGLPTDGHPVTVSALLAELIQEARDAAEWSGGTLDPTIGSALESLGYDRDIEIIRRDGAAPRAVVRTVPGWRKIRLTGTTLRLPIGIRLDLGATAKASAADRCVQAVHAALGTGALLSLGGDIATAGPTPAGGWQVGVQDQPDDPFAQVALHRDGAIATSSTVKRTWLQGDQPRHHIVDPATGRESDTYVRSVTVVGPTCREANIAATGAIVRGVAAADWLRQVGLPARLLDRDGRLVIVNGWPEEAAA